MALQERPKALYIEMVNPHPDLELIDGRRIYVLRQLWKPWYKDGDTRQVQISRCGFPLIPDFGSTAHAYCGFSLDACIGDLLDWWDKPTRETSVRGYIINSRIRTADRLIIARPYSPEPFDTDHTAQQARTLIDQMRSYQDWYHVERVLDQKEHDDYKGHAEEEFFEGF